MDHIRKLKQGPAEEIELLRKRIEELESSNARHKEIKKALQESEEKFRLLFEKSSDPTLLLDLHTFIDCNEAALKLLHLSSKEQLIGLRHWDLSPSTQPDGRESAEKGISLVEETLRKGRNRFEWMRRAPSGEEIWMDVSHTVIPIRGRMMIYSVWRDIRERKKVEAELRTANQHLLDIIELLPDATFVIDSEKRVIAWNRACEELTGVKKEDIVGKGEYEYAVAFYGEKKPVLIDCISSPFDELKQTYPSVTRSGRSIYAEIFIQRLHNGKGAHLAGVATSLLDGDGKTVGAIESIRDITEIKNLEMQLRQAQKMEAVGTLAGGVAHDFNNILTTIAGYGYLAKEGAGESERLKTYIDHVLAAAEKAANLTRSLLAFSRKQVFEPKPYSINAVIEGIEALLRRLLTENIDFFIVLSEPDVVILADVIQIEQILMNLVANSKDAMPDGGTLVVEASRVQLDEEFIKFHGFGKPGRYALISVMDTGIGMDGETKEKIFEPFFTTKGPGKGTGLGLSIVYGIVTQHNGYIHVYSEPDKGTTFKIYIPSVDDSDAADTSETEKEARGGNETVLVAEDDDRLRMLVKAVLESKGYMVLEARDGMDALSLFAENQEKITVMILDVVMPRKNGKEVFEEIRLMKPEIKTLFVSGYTGDIVFEKGILNETTFFINKPFSPNLLLAKLREIIGS